MRPVKLTMKAFGSFAKETVVDFEKLNGGLYLIVGKTGAGKTTIFDAISFALFGKPSGSERDPKMMHSDFAGMDEDTVVTLDFVHQNRRYHVERTIHFRKKRGTDDYGDQEISAVMSGEGMSPVEKATRVTARCEELLGMNGDQFKRIVMLAQGEFREFMKANSIEKNNILGKLFDSTEYVRYQSLLKAVRDDLNGKVKAQNDSIANAMKYFVLPDGEEEEAFLPGNPHLEENLCGLVERGGTRLGEWQGVCEKWSARVGELNKSRGAAETNNALFGELGAKRAHLEELAAMRETVSEKQRIYEAAEKAQHGVKPHDEAHKKAQKDYSDTVNQIKELQTAAEMQREAVRKAEEQMKADEPLTTEKDRLTAHAKVLSDSLPGYKALTKKEKSIQEMQKALEGQKLRLEKLSAQRSDTEVRTAAVTAELEGLEGCDRDEERLKLKGQTARSQYDAVAPEKENSVSANVRTVLKDEKALAKEEGNLAGLARNALDAENDYHEKYQNFISGQAGLIARGMEQELADRGETLCPVCKTHFVRGQEHCFACVPVETPSKEEVDKADQLRKSEDKKYQDKKAYTDGKRLQMEERKSGIIGRMSELGYDSIDWETLVSPGYLDYICEERRRELDGVIGEYREARARVDRKKKLDAEKKKLCDGQTELIKQFDVLDRERQQSELEIIRIQGEAEQLRKQLSYESEAEAGKELAAMNKRIGELQSVLSRHEEALNKARETAHLTEGAVRQLEDSLPGKESALQKAGNDLADSLASNCFGTYEDYRQAAGYIVGNAENWLKDRKAEIDSYYNDLKNTKTRVGELETQTQGKAIIDLAGLNSELAEAQSTLSEAEHNRTVQYNMLSNHQNVLKTVENANKELSRLQGAFRRIDRLAGLATGMSGVRVSFDRFVMGAIFREVLEMANRRLAIMTGGRFELIFSVEADRQSASAGLEMEVHDISTGKQRSSATISGGEGFMVSLALALGLSDVVQSHAGGKKLDTLFIDEGFGTLDDGKLDNVIQVLQQLTEGNRLVGIISHVDKLEESIPQKLRVSAGKNGSTVSVELS